MSEKTFFPSSYRLSFNRAFALELKVRLRRLFKSIEKLHPKLSRRQIHQWRVLSRRSRAALRILKNVVKTKDVKELRKIVKSLTKIFGPVRSLDVSQSLLKQWLKSQPRATRKRLGFCNKALQKAKGEERSKLGAKLQHKEFHRNYAKSIEALTSHTARQLVLAQEWKRHSQSAGEKARRALTQYRRSGNISHLHQFRIRLKQWRYLLELEVESEKSRSPSLSLLKSLQDEIGALHDLEVLREFLQREELVKTAKQCGAQKELQGLVNDIKAKIVTGERRFLPRRGRDLNRLFPARSK